MPTRRRDPARPSPASQVRTLRVATLFPLLALLAGCNASERSDTASPEPAGDGKYLFVFAGDGDHAKKMSGDHKHGAAVAADTTHHSDFLAVIDVDSTSATYAQVVATAPIGATGTMPHHMELEMPTGGRPLFASGFMAGRTYLFDLSPPISRSAAAPK